MRGYGWTPYFVEGSDPDTMHQAMAATMEHCVPEIQKASEGSARDRRCQAAALADDRAALSQRLERAARKSTVTGSKASGAPTRCRWRT